MNAVVYLRRSVDRGEANDVSLSFQEQDCRRKAAALNLGVIGVWTDLVSGRRADNRVQFQTMLATPGWVYCIVWKLDRFARDELDTHQIIRDLERSGRKLLSATEDLENPFIRSIYAAAAAEESRRIGARVSATRRQIAASGRWPGAVPFGLRNDGGVLKPGLYFDVLVEGFRRAAAGEGLHSIVRWANAGPLAARPISLRGARNWFRNPAYAGRIVWAGIETEGGWPPLIDSDIYARATAMMEAKRHHRPQTEWASRLWVHGLATCGRCGARMKMRTGTNGKGARYGYLHCGRTVRGQPVPGCRTPIKVYNASRVQSAAVEQIQRIVVQRDPTLVRDEIRQWESLLNRAPSKERGMVERKLAAAERRRDRADLGYVEGVYTAERARELKGTADAEIAALRAHLARLERPTLLPIDRLTERLSSDAWLQVAMIDPPVFRETLREMIKAIVVPDGAALCRVRWVWEV